MKISDRLTALRTKLGLTQPDAARKFSILVTTWKKYEAGPSEPGAGALRNLADGGVNIHWLLTGEGEMLLEDAKQWPSNLEARNDLLLSLAGDKEAERRVQARDETLSDRSREIEADLQRIETEVGLEIPQLTRMNFRSLMEKDRDFTPIIRLAVQELAGYINELSLIPFYDVEASAGHGSLIDQELQSSQMAFRKDWLKQKGLQASKCALIKAKGDSMEPTIHDGDLLLVDTSIDAIKDDSIYIVQTDSHLIVKRLQQNLDGSLTIISDNKVYNQQIIGPDQAKEVKIAGRVRWYGHEI